MKSSVMLSCRHSFDYWTYSRCSFSHALCIPPVLLLLSGLTALLLSHYSFDTPHYTAGSWDSWTVSLFELFKFKPNFTLIKTLIFVVWLSDEASKSIDIELFLHVFIWGNVRLGGCSSEVLLSSRLFSLSCLSLIPNVLRMCLQAEVMILWFCMQRILTLFISTSVFILSDNIFHFFSESCSEVGSQSLVRDLPVGMLIYNLVI